MLGWTAQHIPVHLFASHWLRIVPHEALRTVHFYLFQISLHCAVIYVTAFYSVQDNHDFYLQMAKGLLYKVCTCTGCCCSMNCEAIVPCTAWIISGIFVCYDDFFSAMVCRGYRLYFYVFYRKGNIHLPTCGSLFTYLWITLVRVFFNVYASHVEKSHTVLEFLRSKWPQPFSRTGTVFMLSVCVDLCI